MANGYKGHGVRWISKLVKSCQVDTLSEILYYKNQDVGKKYLAFNKLENI